MTSYTGRLLSGSIFIFFIGLLSAFTAFLFRVILARNLSLAEFGLFYAVFVFVGFFSLLRNFGLGAALIKHVPEFKVKKEYNLIKSTIIITSSLRILISLLLGLTFFLLSDFLAVNYFHNIQASLVLKLLSLFFFLSVFVDITRNLFEAFQKPFHYPFVDLLKNVSVLLFVLILFYLGLGILSPVVAYLAMTLLIPLLFLPFIIKSFEFSKYKLIISKELVKKLFLFGLPFVFISTASIVIAQIDTLLLTYFRTLEEVGIYNVVLPTSLLLLQFSNAIVIILFPLCSELWAKGDKKSLANVINFIYKYSLIFVIPIGFLVFAFAPALLNLFFGKEYAVGANAMRILLIGVFFYTIANVNQYVLAGIGKPKITANIVIFVALFNFIGNLILVPYYGIFGAALVTALSYIISLVLSLIYLKKLTQFKVSMGTWPKILVSGLFVIFIVYVLKYFFSFNVWIELISFSAIALIIYCALLFALKVTTLSEIKGFLKRNIK